MLKIDNYIINKSILEILNILKLQYPNGKLRDIKVKSTELVVTCPNDNHTGGAEKNADNHINLVDQPNLPEGTWNCFGCGESGSFEKFVALYFSSSVSYAKNWLITNFGELATECIKLDDDIVLGKKQSSKKLDEMVLSTYQSYCPYLQKRGISRTIAEQFNIKYDPKYRQVIFPVYNIKNELVMFAKRNIDTKTFFMTADVEKEVYCLNYVIKNNIKKVVISEGPFDTLSGWEHNIPTIGTLGSISDYQIDKINKSGIRFLYLAFDNDAAGKKFAQFIKSKLDNRILVTDIELPVSKKDLNELTEEDWKNIKEKYSL